MNAKSLGRRSFVAQSLAVTAGMSFTAASYARVAGSNERIAIGLIGCGNRGSHLRGEALKHGDEANSHVVAVCDIWKVPRAAAAQHVSDIQGNAPKQYVDYRKLLEHEGLHGVIIATPDHQHPIMLRDAAQCHLDAYVEKPLAINFDDLCEAYDAVKSNHTLFQAGTQLRSLPSFTGCRELVRSGRLGRILRVEQARNEYLPYWYQYRREIHQEDTDWNAFIMHAPFQKWDPEVYTAWMGYRPFSNGAFGGLMSHFTDLVHYITGSTLPSSAVAISWENQLQDSFTVPDSVQAVFDYPEGFSVSYQTTTGNGGAKSFRLVAANGILDMQDWYHPVLSGEGSQEKDAIQANEAVSPVDHDKHMLDFLKCIRSRKQPNANIDAGFSHAITAIMADEALLRGKRITFDATQRKLVEV
ncbi:Gfo/Idh/MocA family oxidoreductase [bacterium]|nr:Gfo/Idh/MocA family oxidoreductase [bacterium]